MTASFSKSPSPFMSEEQIVSEQQNPAKSGPDKVPTPRKQGLHKKLIDNVGVSLEAFLGDAKMTVAELTALKEDSIVTLGATLAQSVELRLNGIPVAKGELVAIGDNFGVRLTEISQ